MEAPILRKSSRETVLPQEVKNGEIARRCMWLPRQMILNKDDMDGSFGSDGFDADDFDDLGDSDN